MSDACDACDTCSYNFYCELLVIVLLWMSAHLTCLLGYNEWWKGQLWNSVAWKNISAYPRLGRPKISQCVTINRITCILNLRLDKCACMDEAEINLTCRSRQKETLAENKCETFVFMTTAGEGFAFQSRFVSPVMKKVAVCHPYIISKKNLWLVEIIPSPPSHRAGNSAGGQ